MQKMASVYPKDDPEPNKMQYGENGTIVMNKVLTRNDSKLPDPVVYKEDDGIPELSQELTIFQCARNGYVDELRSILETSAEDINEDDDDHVTALHYAARYNRLAVVKLLLERGADADAQDDEGLTPLHYACRIKRKRKKGKKSRFDLFGDPEANDTGDSGDSQSLSPYRSNDTGVILALVNKDQAVIKKTDSYGLTALHHAALRGDEVACETLLSLDKQLAHTKDIQQMTPLHTAACQGESDIVRQLIKAGANVFDRDEELSTPLHEAASVGFTKTAKIIFDACNVDQVVNGVCSCNISVLDQGQVRSTDVTCDGPAANLRTAIMSVTGGFVRVEIRYHGDIEGSFIIRFTAVNKNTRLTASCGTGAKRIGLPNLETCVADDTSIAVDEDDVVSGPGCSLTNPGYPGEDDSSPSNGLSMYHCSVQASCVTNINAFVMLNTLQERNGICSCNITLNGDGTTSNVTCDGPAGNYFTPVFSVVNGFIRTAIYYHGTIYGKFFILFRAVDKYAKLTAACGSRARQIGATDLDTCAAFGTGDGSLEVHTNNTRNGSDVSVTNPGYGGGTVPGTSGLSLYQCSVQASCNTQIKAYVLVNTLQKRNNMCFCNITLTADSSTTDVTCDGPAQNRHAPIVSISSGFVKVDVAYRASTSGDFVLEFRAVNRNAVLAVGCGTQAAQSGISNLGACRRYGDGDITIPIDEDGRSRDTEVTITEPSALQSTGTGRYTCSVHAYCNTTIEAFLLTNRIQKVNGVCSGTITLHGSDATSVVTCDGLGSNRFVPIFTEPRGFLRVQFDYTRTNTGQFKLAFRANANTEGGGGGNSNLIIIIVVVVVVVVLLVLAVILWICRQRIRSKLCPQKSKPSIEPIEGVTIIEKPIRAPTPGNTKFPGRSPNDMTTPKGKLGRMPSSSSMVDYLYKEKMDSEKNTMATTLPAFTRDKDAVVNTKFKRRQTLQELVQTQGQKFDEAEQKKQKKKSKKMKKLKRKMTNARNVITASRAFELQKSYDASESVGTYRPLGEGLMHNGTVHPEGLYPGATMDQPPLPFTPYVHGHSFMGSMPGPGIPNFAVSGAEADHPVPGPAHLPPLVMANQPRPAHLPPLPFSSGTAWKKAGAASGVAGRMVVKKKRTLDISSIDDPGSVEHAELY